jgi:hypothetical protein
MFIGHSLLGTVIKFRDGTVYGCTELFGCSYL